MKLSSISRNLAMLAVAAGMIAASTASAILSTTSASYVGEIENGAPSNPTSEASFINYLTSLSIGATNIQLGGSSGEIYDRVGSSLDATSIPAAVTTGASKFDPPTATFDASSHQYVYAKYGNYSLVWFSATGFSSTESLVGYSGNLSHHSLYNPISVSVPDGGVTIALLGMTLLGFASLSRFLRR